MKEDLVAKFQELKTKHDKLLNEKLKYETKMEQLDAEIKVIQDKYKEYDLSSVESIDSIINKLTEQISTDLASIEEQYSLIKDI